MDASSVARALFDVEGRGMGTKRGSRSAKGEPLEHLKLTENGTRGGRK
jgi:hypothetical protein